MFRKIATFTLLLIGSLATVPAVTHLRAAQYTWDTVPGTVGLGDGAITGGNGPWNNTVGDWTTNGGANNVAWVGASGDGAIFGANAGVVTISNTVSGVTANQLAFNVTGYSIAANHPATDVLTLVGNTPTVSVIAGGGATNNAVLAGTSGFTLTGGGTFLLNQTAGAANMISGPINLNAGALWAQNTTTMGSGVFTGLGTASINLNDGATLQLSQVLNTPRSILSVNSALAVAGAATLSLGPGSGTGNTAAMFFFNSITLASGSLLNVVDTGMNYGYGNRLGGPVILNGNATIRDTSGAKYWSGGSAQLSAVTVGSLPADGSITTLTLDGGNNSSSISQAMTDNGAKKLALVKDGIGGVALNAANTFSGGTIVNGGTLIVSNNAGTGPLQVNAGGNFGVGAGTLNTCIVSALGLADGARLSFDWINSAVDKLVSTAAATTAGSVGISFNTLTAPGGSGLALISSATGGLSGANYYLANNTSFTATLTRSANALTIGNYAAVTPPATFYWQGNKVTGTNVAGADNAWSLSSGSTGNWSSSQGSYTATAVVPGSAANVVFSASGAAQQTTVLGADMTVNSVTFNDPVSFTVGGGKNILTLLSTATSSGASAITVGSTANATNIINANVNFGGASTETINVASGKNLNLAGQILGAFTLSLAGSGTLNLSGTNTFSGAISIGGGVLAISGGGQLGGPGGVLGQGVYSGGISISSGATFIYNSSAAQTLGGVISSAGSLTQAGPGTLTLAGANTFTGTTTVSGGALLVNGSTAAGSAVFVQNTATLGGTGTIGGPVTVNSGGNIQPTLGGFVGTLTLASSTAPSFAANCTLKLRVMGRALDSMILSSATPVFDPANLDLVIDASGLTDNIVGAKIVSAAKGNGGIAGGHAFHSVTVTGNSNYAATVHYNPALGTITVDLTAILASVTLGSLTQTYTGLAAIPSATTLPAGLPVSFTYDGSPNPPVNAGTYQVIGTTTYNGQTASATNNLTVNPAALIVTANGLYLLSNGVPFTGGAGVTYSGFVNGETSAVLGGTLIYGGNSQGATNVGSYAITPYGLASTNYNITYVNGTLIIAPPGPGYVFSPQPLGCSVKNPLTGWRGKRQTPLTDTPPGNVFTVDPGYETLKKWYLGWSEMETNASSGMDAITNFLNVLWTNLPGNNEMVVPRIVLIDAGGSYIPNDLPAIGATYYDSPWYTNASVQPRIQRLISRLGQAWNNDPRVAWVEMGVEGKYGEHWGLGNMVAGYGNFATWMYQQFTNAFTNKLVMVRYVGTEGGMAPLTPLSQSFPFGFYQDSFAYSLYNSELAAIAALDNSNRWKYAVNAGEIRSQNGDPDLSPTDVNFDLSGTGLQTLLNWTRQAHTSHLGWDMDNLQIPTGSIGGEAIRSALGYHFLITGYQQSLRADPGGTLNLSFSVINTGSSPFYYRWPVKVALVDESTQVPVFSQILTNDIRQWLPGSNWNSNSAAYQTPPATNVISAAISIPTNMPTGAYIVSLAVLNPAGGNLPAVRFEIQNYWPGGMHPMGRLGVGTNINTPVVDAVSFYTNAIDASVHYTLNPPPVAPTRLNATPGNTRTSLSWTAVSGTTSYNLKRATVSGGLYRPIASLTTTNYTDAGVVNGTTYFYVVSAVNGNGESTNSSEASATPNAPTIGIQSIALLPGRNLSLTTTGTLGAPYRLWAGTNLAATPVTKTWTLLNSGTITSNPFTINSLTITNHPQQFYLFTTP